jgi:hypothetical protein
MPLIIAALWGGFLSALGSIVGRVLVSLGIGYVAFSGANALQGWIKDRAFEYLNSASSISTQVTQLMGVLQIGTCISILFSAVSIALGLKLTSGVVKKMVVK